MTRRCTRCTAEFVPHTPEEHRCRTCAAEVAELLAIDIRRRTPRFVSTKDLSGAGSR